jgi:cell division protein FtsL
MTLKMATLGNLEKRLFYGFLIVAILFLGTYIYFANLSLFNIGARNHAQEKIGQLRTEVASLEAEYLSLSGREITPDYARSLGFKDISNAQSYAVSASKTVALSLVSANDLIPE